MIIAIDPGHGGSDPGATNGSYREKDYTLKISLYQAKRFKELGVNVILTRDKDIFLRPSQRAEIVNRSKAFFCISNHINAATNSQANGVEVVHSIHDETGLAGRIIEVIAKEGLTARRPLCKTLMNNKVNPPRPQLRDGKLQDWYFVPRLFKPQSLIIEYGFISNSGDLNRLIQDWQKYAEAVVRMICSYLGIGYKVPGEGGVDMANTPKVTLDGKEVVFPDVKPQIINGRMMVPLRGVFEQAGFTVQWDAATNTANLTTGKK